MPTTHQTPVPPRTAAVAGIVFSVLTAISLTIVRVAAPNYHTDTGVWLTDPFHRNTVRFALRLTPFAGIAFLWFLGVVRNRLGDHEDRFFATVFLGSGLLFVASIFVSGGISEALLETVANGRPGLLNTDVYYVMREAMGLFMNVFAIKMAGVFMLSTSTIMLRTSMLPRWVSFLGFGCALFLLVIITDWQWIALLFPLWVLVVSVWILIADLHSRPVLHPAAT